ncbi:serine/threonine-protein kinase [Plesiocystis pacifica]|nr:serine/threonine-protein kinase [Plesiocystis pacifica]
MATREHHPSGVSSPPSSQGAQTERSGASTERSGARAANLATFEAVMRDAAEDEAEAFEHRRIFASVSQALFGRGRPLSIDRFRVERRLGAGGMGEVYLCTDPELDRAVAVKRVLGSEDARERERLLAEAQALARFSHPNVVQIYEVGEHEGRTYLAMEYVAGQTLGRWLKADPSPSWRARLDCLIAAGRGLAAAHAQGLVHRDFKPDNVLLGQDGRPRVADFGLARASATQTSANADAALPVKAEGLSEPGRLAGTVPYMPLEQLRGEAIDARADQFAFCVVAYEALYGAAPFPRRAVAARLAALERDSVRPPRAGASIPHGIWRALRRGLARDAEARWPTMDALLDALERASVRRRRVGLAAVLAAGLAASVAIGVFASRPGDELARCERAAGKLAHDVAGDEALRGLEARYADSERAHSADSWTRLSARLGQWREAWTAEGAQLCLDRKDQGVESQLLAARETCLARQRRQVGVLIEALEQDKKARRLTAAVGDPNILPDPHSCADPHAPPKPPEGQVAAVVAVEQQLDRARIQRRLGNYRPAYELASASARAAEATEYAPVIAEAFAERAKLADRLALPDAEAQYDAAIDAADRADLDALVAILWVERAQFEVYESETAVPGGEHPEHPEPAEPDLETAQAQLRRAQIAFEKAGTLDARHRARLRLVEARVAEHADDLELAEAGYREALDVDPRPAYASGLGLVLERIGPDRRAEALAMHARALELASAQFGPQHPKTTRERHNLGLALRRLGDTPKDRARANALLTEALGAWVADPNSGAVGLEMELLMLADRGLQERDPATARDAARLLARSGRGAIARQIEAHAEVLAGDPRAAIAAAEDAIRQFEAEDPADARAVSMRSLILDQRLAAANAQLPGELVRGEVEALAAHPGARARDVFNARMILAELELRTGELDAAAEVLEAAERALIEAFATPPADPSAHMGEGKLRWLVLRPLVQLRRAGASAPDDLQALQATLAALPSRADFDPWLDQLGVQAAERASLGL